MKNTIVIKILSIGVNVITSFLLALFILALQDWFGSGDINTFTLWTIPLACGISVSGPFLLSLLSMKNLWVRLRLLVFISCVISFAFMYLVDITLGPWIQTFSLPIFYLWVIGVVAQLLFLDATLPQSKEKPSITTALKHLLLLPFTVVIAIVGIYEISSISTYFNKPAAETFLIPNDFQGKIRIVYGEPCGIDPPFVNGRRILEIPENGFLILQPDFKAGLIDHEYYFVDAIGNREVAIQLYENSAVEKRVRLGPSGNIGGAMPDGSFSSKSPLAIEFTDLYIQGSPELPTEKALFKSERRIDSLTTALIDICRGTI